MRHERLELLRERYRGYLEAEQAIRTSQSYSLNGVSLTRADLGKVQDMIAKLEVEIMKETRKVQGLHRSRVRVVVPVDRFSVRRRCMH